MTKPIEISDLIGLKDPLMKLIEVVANGIGVVYEPTKIRRLADARAYEIHKISATLKQAEVSGEIVYDEMKFNLSTSLINGEICDQLTNRMLLKELKRQDNTDNIISIAHQELGKVEYVSDKQVDNDWVTKFFRISEDISSEEMQLIWGKILAGEIIAPNTYSLRTLDILKNLNFHEAELFSKIGKLAIKDGISAFLIRDVEFLKKEFNISFNDLLLLDEINLISSQGLAYIMKPNDDKGDDTLYYADKIIKIITDDNVERQIEIFKFTKWGEELLSFIEQDFSETYIKKIGLMIKNNNTKVTYFDVIKGKDNSYECSEVGIEI